MINVVSAVHNVEDIYIYIYIHNNIYIYIYIYMRNEKEKFNVYSIIRSVVQKVNHNYITLYEIKKLKINVHFTIVM